MGQTWMRILIWMTLIGSMAGLAAVLLRFVCGKLPKKWTVYLWLIVFFRLSCPVSVTTPFSAFRLVEISGDLISEQPSVRENGPQETEKQETPLQEKTVSNTAPHIDISASENTEFQQWAERLWLLWLSGAAAVVIISLMKVLRLKKRLSGAVRISGRIFIADDLPGAFLFGVFRPGIYLPASFTGETRSMMLLHEQTHAKYGDHLWKQLAFLCLVIHWFNPLVWLFFRLFSSDLETACDERVIQRMDRKERIGYAKALTAALEGRPGVMNVLPFRSRNTVGRVRRIVMYRKPTWRAATAACVLLVLVTAAFATNSAAMSSENPLAWTEDTMDRNTARGMDPEIRASLFTQDGRLKRADLKPLLNIPYDTMYYLKGYASYDASSVNASMQVKNTLGYCEEVLGIRFECYCYNGAGAIVGMCHASKSRYNWNEVECSANGTCYAAPAYATVKFTFRKKNWTKTF